MVNTDWTQLPLLLSVRETAKIIGYGPARIRELCRVKAIPCVRLGRAYRIPKDALQQWLVNKATTIN